MGEKLSKCINGNLLHNFPVIIYWIDQKGVVQGCNLEACRNFNEITKTNHQAKFFIKLFIFDGSDQIIGSIMFELSNISLTKHFFNGVMPYGVTTDTEDPINNANLQFIFEHAPIAFWMMDKNGVFIDGNPQAFRAAGVDSAEAFVGKTLADFTNMKNRSLEIIQKLNAINTEVIQTGIEASFVEYPVNIYDELSFMHQAACALRPIFDNNRQVIGIAGVSFFNDKQTNLEFVVPESERPRFFCKK